MCEFVIIHPMLPSLPGYSATFSVCRAFRVCRDCLYCSSADGRWPTQYVEQAPDKSESLRSSQLMDHTSLELGSEIYEREDHIANGSLARDRNDKQLVDPLHSLHKSRLRQ